MPCIVLAGGAFPFRTQVVWTVTGGRVSAAEKETLSQGNLVLDGADYPVYGSTFTVDGAAQRRVIPKGRGFAYWPELVPRRHLLYAEWGKHSNQSGKDLARFYGIDPTYQDPTVQFTFEGNEAVKAEFRKVSLLPVFGQVGDQPERAVVIPDQEWYVGYTIQLDKKRQPVRDDFGKIVTGRPVTMLSQAGLMQTETVQATLPGSILGWTCFQAKISPVGVFRETRQGGVDFHNLATSPIYYPQHYLFVEFAQEGVQAGVVE